MIYKAWSSIEEVPYCLSRSSVKFQGHSGRKISNFDPNWAFLDCNCSLNSPIGLKWCTKLGVVQKRCPIVFRGHPSNLKVTWTEKSMIWINFKQNYWAGHSYPWWRHQMETFSALLAICAGHSSVTSEFPGQRPVPRSFDVFFDLRLNKRLSKQSWGWWFETLSRPLWRHRNANPSDLPCYITS